MNCSNKDLIERITAKMLAIILNLDVFVAGKVVVGFDDAEGFDPVSAAQLLTCLRVTGGRGKMRINFEEPTRLDGFNRYVV
jgi:hypothetical protein